MVDPIADMLTRIRNAIATKKREVYIPYSKIKFNIVKILEKEGWLGKTEVLDLSKGLRKQAKYSHGFKQIVCHLIYNEDNKSKIEGLRRISKPGCRVYVKKNEIRPVRDSYGLSIISTSQGLMTGKEAKKKALGGEYICEVW